ncbi:MAG: hypothetical protein KBT20_08320 [Bacteroidales bacterium]|nr:hypothetical protein [Candidatus Liminaster caballi]
MMKHYFLTAALMAFALAGFAQSEQQIEVREYNEKQQKTPLADVGVTVLNAGAAMSDQNGLATLRFRTLHAGDRVTVRRIEKSGYEIFNKQALEQWNVSPQRPFMIVLCKADRLRALRDQYSRVASESYERQYKQEQARLAAERKKTAMLEEEYQKKLTDLENQYQQQLEDLENYVDQFARIDLSELNGKQQKLIKLVKDGKIDEAIRQYESEDFQAQYEKQSQEIAKIDQAQEQLSKLEAKKRSQRESIHAAIGRQVATYRLAGGRENFQKVTDLLKAVADADTTQLLAVWEYAEHALKQNDLDESVRYRMIYIRGCKNNPERYADGWRRQGQAYMRWRKFDEANRCFQISYHIDDSLSAAEPGRFAPRLAQDLRQLALFYRWTNNLAKLTETLARGIEVSDRLYAEEPESYAEIASNMYAEQALCLLYGGKADEAVSTSKKAVEIARTISKDQYESFVSLNVALTNQSQIYYMTNDWKGLIEAQSEYVHIQEKFYEQNPLSTIQYLQSGYNNLAEANLHLPNLEECEKYLLKSEQLLNEIMVTDPEAHRYDEFNLCDIGAHLYEAMGNRVKSDNYVERAISAFGKMNKADQDSNRELFDALIKIRDSH